MAKDDYYIIVAKILVFLYKKLKGKEKRDIKEYIIPMTNDFPINEDYLNYVIEKMLEQGFVEKVTVIRAWGGDIVGFDYSEMRITPLGIDYMLDNSRLRKVIEGLKEAAEISSLFKPL